MIIGISGKARSGKNLVAKLVSEVSNDPVTEIAFAAKLKESFAALFGIPPSWLEALKTSTSQIKIHPDPDLPFDMIEGLWDAEINFREALQRYGTEAHRDIFTDSFWIDEAFRGLDAGRNIIVVTDVRFPNELNEVKKRGGFLVKVRRQIESIKENDHPSEQDLPDNKFDWLIDNDGSVDELRLEVAAMVAWCLLNEVKSC